MKKVFLNGVMALTAGSLIGCGSKFEANIQQAVVDNQNAASLIQWEQSEAHPATLFAKWRQELASADSAEELKAELCSKLSELPGQDLTVFEAEIQNKENQELLQGCKVALAEKIEQHYSNERSQLSVKINALNPKGSLNRFQFPDNVQKRDTTNGYFAVSGDVGRKEVILTFDDGPSGVYTESILRSLKEVNAKAIFFLLGKNVQANPEIVKKVAKDGHAVASHSMTHPCLGTSRACAKTNGRNLTFAEASGQIKAGAQAVYNVLGYVDPFFRFPYGESSAELKSFLKQSSVGEFYWSIDSEDWKAQPNSTLIKNTLARLEARGRGMLLFHDIQRRTAEIMPELLRELYSRGYSIVLLQSSDEAARYNSKLVKKNLP